MSRYFCGARTKLVQNYINIWIDQIEMDGTLKIIRTKWLGE